MRRRRRAKARRGGKVAVTGASRPNAHGGTDTPLLDPDEARDLAFDLLAAAAEVDEGEVGADLDDMNALERRAFALHGEPAALSAQFEEHPDEDVSQGRLTVYYDLDDLRGEDA